MFSFFRSHRACPISRVSHRRLIVEPLERRELLSVSLGSDDPMAAVAEVAGAAESASGTLELTAAAAVDEGESSVSFGPWDLEYSETIEDLTSVAVDGNVMVVGTVNDDIETIGSVRVYRRRDDRWQEDPQELLPLPVGADRYFGTNVALAEGRLFITSHSTIYVFRDVSTDGGPGGWQLEAELVPSDPNAMWVYWGGFDTDGSRIIAGMSNFSAIIFSRDGHQWREEAKLLMADHVPVREDLGLIATLVSIDGDVAIISSLLDNDFGDKVYVFEQVDGQWAYRQELTFEDTTSFGVIWSITVDGDTLAIAVDGENIVDVFERGADGWQRTAKLRPGESNRRLRGAKVVIHDDTMLVSQVAEVPGPEDQIPGVNVTVFRRDESGWQKQTVLASPDSQILDRFSAVVATDGRTIVAAAVDQASIYVFGVNDEFSPATPEPLPDPPRPDPPPLPVPSVSFGPWDLEYLETIENSQVAVDGDLMVVGTVANNAPGEYPDGIVRVYRRRDDQWQKDPQELLSPSFGADRYFGTNVALAEGRLFVTSHTKIYVFRDGGPDGWKLEAELVPSDPNAMWMYWGGFDTDGSRVIVGMSDYSAIIFSRDGNEWHEEARLLVADYVPVPRVEGGLVGTLVSIDGDVAVISADHGGDRGNKVHIFEQVDGTWIYRQHAALDSPSNHISSMTVDGDTLAISIVGENVVDVYERGASGWQRTAKLHPGESDHRLGGSKIVIHDDTILVSQVQYPEPPSPDDEIAGGNVTVFKRGAGGWNKQAVLAAPDSQIFDGFGSVLATDGQIIVAMAVDRTDGGTVRTREPYVVREEALPSRLYVFGFNDQYVEELLPEEPPTPEPWRWENPPEVDSTIDFSPWAIEYAEADLDFERSRVAVDGDVMVVGLPLDDSLAKDAGLVNVYRRVDGAWQKDPAPLVSPRGEADRNFGNRVVLEGDRLFVTSARTVYVFRAGPLGTWQIEAELTPDSGNEFGVGLGEIDTDGQRLIVSTSSFSAAVFSRDGETWREEAVLSVAETVDAPSQSPDSLVAIDGDTAVLRADRWALPEGMRNRVHVFEIVEGIWTERQQLIVDSEDRQDVTAVEIDGDTIAIAIQSGSVIDLYHRGDDGWQRSTKLYDPGRSFLGAEIVLHGELLLLGHYPNGSPTTSTSGEEILGGSITVFRRDGTNWHEETVLAAPNSRHLDRFGISFATDGETIVVTAIAQLEQNDWVGPPSGIYVFALQEAPIPEPPPEIPPDDDFLLRETVIDGFVWHDLDRDGRQDEGEPGIENVGVRLFDAIDNNHALDVRFTDADGRYSINLPPGQSVYLEFGDLPDGFTFTHEDNAEDDTLDSDVDRLTGRTEVFTVPAAVDRVVIDAGLLEWIAPQGIGELSASAASSRQVELTWTDADVESGYRLYQWDGQLERGVLIATLPRGSTSHSVENLNENQSYFYSVEAFNGGGSSWLDWQQVSTPRTPPKLSEPSVLVVDSSSQITVSWSSADDADGYRVYQWNGEKGALIASLPSDAASHVVTGLPAGGRHFFTVEAFNDGGSDFTAWNSASTLLAEVISSLEFDELSASAFSSTQVDLTWLDTDVETGYRVFQWDHQLGRGVLIETLPADNTSHLVENLNADQLYFFSLEAFNEGGSSWSDWQQVRTPPAPPELSGPSVLVVDSSSQITVSWSPADAADGYRVYQWNGEKGALIASLPSDATSHVVTGLPAGGEHFFTVEAFNDGGSDFTPWNSASTLLVEVIPSSEPDDLLASAFSSTQVDLAWADRDTETGYHVFQWDHQLGHGVLIATLPADSTSHAVENLNAEQQYFFSLEAFNEIGSFWSDWQQVGTPNNHPVMGLWSVAVDSSSQVTVGWSPVGDAEGYRVYQRYGVQVVMIAALPGDATSRVVTGLSSGSGHTFMVEAFNDDASDFTSWLTVILPPTFP